MEDGDALPIWLHTGLSEGPPAGGWAGQGRSISAHLYLATYVPFPASHPQMAQRCLPSFSESQASQPLLLPTSGETEVKRSRSQSGGQVSKQKGLGQSCIFSHRHLLGAFWALVPDEGSSCPAGNQEAPAFCPSVPGGGWAEVGDGVDYQRSGLQGGGALKQPVFLVLPDSGHHQMGGPKPEPLPTGQGVTGTCGRLETGGGREKRCSWAWQTRPHPWAGQAQALA